MERGSAEWSGVFVVFVVAVFACHGIVFVVLGEERVVGFIAERGAELVDAAALDLPDAFAGEVEERADLFERDAASVGDIKSACFGHFPDFEVREVHFDGAGLRDDIEIEVIFARHPRAWPWGVSAVASGARPELFEGLQDALSFFDFLARQASDCERFGTS